MEKLTRNYSVKDVDMIITASTIIKNAISKKTSCSPNAPAGAAPILKTSKTA
ncbi:hypothetical protein D3C86_1016170 [compost metagenome]